MKKVLLFILIVLTCGAFVACNLEKPAILHIDAAKVFMQEGQFRSASLELKNAIQKEPNNIAARLLLGEVYLETGDFTGAIKELQTVVRLGGSRDKSIPLLARALFAGRGYEELGQLSLEDLSDASRATVLAAQGLGDLASGNRRLAEFKILEAVGIDSGLPFASLAQVRLSLYDGKVELAQSQIEKLLSESPDYAPAWTLKGDLEQNKSDLQNAESAYTRAIDLLAFNADERLKRAIVLIELKQYDRAAQDITFLSDAFPKSPGTNYAKGLLAFETGDLASALVALEQVVSVSSSYPMALYYLSLIHYRQMSLQQAERYANQFVSVTPAHNAGRKLLSAILFDSGSYAEAEEMLRPIVDFNEYDIGAFNLMANVLERQGKIEESLALLAKVAELQPNSAMAQIRLAAVQLLSGDLEGNAKSLAAARALDPDLHDIAKPLIVGHLRAGRYDIALRTAHDFQRNNPDSVEPYNLMARAYLADAHVEQAEKAYSEAILISPGNPEASNGLALIAIGRKQIDSARKYYAQVLAHNPDHLATLNRLALLEKSQGNTASMLEYLQRALLAHPNSVEPRLLLARHYLGEGRPDQVPFLFSVLGKEDQNRVEVLDLVARAQFARKQYNEAATTLAQLVRQQPNSAETHYRLASAYAGINDREKMQEQLLRTLELQPDTYEARLALGRLLLLKGDKAGTQQQLDALEAQHGENPDVLELAASLANHRGDYDQALQLLKAAFARDRTEPRMQMLARQMSVMGNTTAAENLKENWAAGHPPAL